MKALGLALVAIALLSACTTVAPQDDLDAWIKRMPPIVQKPFTCKPTEALPVVIAEICL